MPLSLSKFNPVWIRDNVKTSFVGSKKKGGFASSKTKSNKSGVTVEILKGKKETYNLDSPPVKPEVIVSSGNQFGYSDPTESRKETAFDNFSVNDFENNSTSKKDDGAPF